MGEATIIDGVALSKHLREEVSKRAAVLTAMGKTPGLAVVLVGENPASAVYVRNKVKACEQHGLASTLDRLPATVTVPLLACCSGLKVINFASSVLVVTATLASIDSAAESRTVSNTSTAAGSSGFWLRKCILRRGVDHRSAT